MRRLILRRRRTREERYSQRLPAAHFIAVTTRPPHRQRGWASAVSLLGLGAAEAHTARASAESPQLAGSWLVTRGPNSGPIDMNTFFADGNMVGANVGHLSL
jgi:hypothetical protein